MPVTKIENASFNDITNSIQYLLNKSKNNESVKQLANQITQNQEDKILAIYNFVKSNIYYVADPIDSELFTSPIKMVETYYQGGEMIADCDDYAIFTTALFRAIGYSANVVIIDQRGDGWDHAYCQVWSEKLNQYITCDASTNQYPLGWVFEYKNIYIVQ